MVESCFATEFDKFKLQRSALSETPKSGKKKEQEKTVLEIIEVIAPILIKTVCAAMRLQVAHLDKEVQSLKTGLAARDEQIDGLVKKVATLEAEADRREQYSRRPNLRFQGITEEDGENTDAVVIGTIQQKLGLTHIGADHLERSHRLGPKKDEQGRPRKRAMIVRFRSEAVRDEVFRARTRLKEYNRQFKDNQIHVNEDLTAKRAMLAYRTRQLKRQKQIADCWTYAGRVLIKTNIGTVKEIVTDQDLPKM